MTVTQVTVPCIFAAHDMYRKSNTRFPSPLGWLQKDSSFVPHPFWRGFVVLCLPSHGLKMKFVSNRSNFSHRKWECLGRPRELARHCLRMGSYLYQHGFPFWEGRERRRRFGEWAGSEVCWICFLVSFGRFLPSVVTVLALRAMLHIMRTQRWPL